MLTALNPLQYLVPDWPGCPAGVNAVTTLRRGGVSEGGFASFNLAGHVGDDPAAVVHNRQLLREQLGLPDEPVWLNQVHGNRVLNLEQDLKQPAPPPDADASTTRDAGRVCAVLTADCLPVFICNTDGTEVAVAHAGWRGLHAGIISATIATMYSTPDDLLVFLGPAIGPKTFEVGEEVRDAFLDRDKNNARAFIPTTGDLARQDSKRHFLCDMYQLARIECAHAGVKQVSGGNHCTYTESEKFYSYRRETRCGRMASLIWLTH
jgi:YfiH family protein